MTEKSGEKKAEAKVAAKVFARYVGNGKQYFIDVPATDLTREQFDSLNPLQQRDVLAGTLYEVAAEKKQDGAN